MVFQSQRVAKRAARQAAQQQQSGQPGGFFGFIDTVASGFDYMWTHPMTSLINGISAVTGLLTFNGKAFNNALIRLGGWVQSNPVAGLKAWVANQVAALENQIVRNWRFAIHYTNTAVDSLTQAMNNGFRSERKYRLAGDAAAERYARQQVAALHSVIEREAASAYRQGNSGQLALVSRVADYLINHSPWVRRLAGDIVAGALDLASIDSPVARLFLGFVVRRLIERLTVDKAAGDFLSGLLGPLLGQPRPRGLAQVVSAITQRLGAGEEQWTKFYEHGGADVEQAGRQWSEITSPVVDAALIAWLGQAVVNPEGWARDIQDTIGRAGTDIVSAAVKLIR